MSDDIRKKISASNKISQKGKHLGDKNSAWKGGITPLNKKERSRLEYRIWVRSVFNRDEYTCQKYKVKGGKLVAHHINNFADYKDLRYIVNNGITLSEKAHKEFHKKYGRTNNTRQQLEEFLCQI